MKRASIAQRLAFILFSIALTSVALAAPPEQAQGEPPPFNEEDCVFENGRTICLIVEEAAPQVTAAPRLYRSDPERYCSDGSVLYEVKKKVAKAITTITVVFYGTSQNVDSYDMFEEFSEEEFEVIGTMCW